MLADRRAARLLPQGAHRPSRASLAPTSALPQDPFRPGPPPENTGPDRSPAGRSRRSNSHEAPSRSPAIGPQGIVVVGAGPAARQLYFPALGALQRSGALVVRAVVDPAESARTAAAECFPNAARVASLGGVVAPPDTLAIIATPARFHAAQIAFALKRDWHVLCAPPFVSDPREGALLVATAQRHQRLLAVDLRLRFFPAVQYLRTLCRDHLLGPPLSFQVHLGPPRRNSETPEAVTENLEYAEGALTELGVPAFDLLTWCLGRVSIVGYADDAMGGVEANAAIDLSFGDGLRGSVHLSRDWPTANAYTFVFERGIVRCAADRANALTLQLASAPAAVDGELCLPLSPGHSPPSVRLLATIDQAGVALLENLHAAIAGREALRTPAAEAMHSLPLVAECYAQRRPLAQPWLTRNEAARARTLCPPAAYRHRP